MAYPDGGFHLRRLRAEEGTEPRTVQHFFTSCKNADSVNLQVIFTESYRTQAGAASTREWDTMTKETDAKRGPVYDFVREKMEIY